MLVLEHMKQLVDAAAPHLRAHGHQGQHKESCADCDLWRTLWADIKPVKFGNTVSWLAATTYTLADYQIPRDTWNVVLRVECYTVDWTNAAADFGLNEPPPPGFAYWQYVPYGTGTTITLTDLNARVQLLLDADEFLIFRPGYTVALIGDFSASPDDLTREVRTLVYSYNCGASIIDRIGNNQVIIPISS